VYVAVGLADSTSFWSSPVLIPLEAGSAGDDKEEGGGSNGSSRGF